MNKRRSTLIILFYSIEKINLAQATAEQKKMSYYKLWKKPYTEKYPGWSCTKEVIEPAINALEVFCKSKNHRLPWQYAFLPWERAYSYIQKFDPMPPRTKS